MVGPGKGKFGIFDSEDCRINSETQIFKTLHTVFPIRNELLGEYVGTNEYEIHRLFCHEQVCL